MQNTAHFAQSSNTVPVQYGQTTVPQIHYVQTPVAQAPVQTTVAPSSAPVETSQQSFFTQGFVDWCSLTDENFALVAKAENEPENFCFMAMVDEIESEEVVTESDIVTADIVDEVVADKKSEEEVVNLSDPWGASDDCECKCDCALMAAAKVSPQILKDLCSDKCVIAFANIKEVNENLRKKVLDDEVQFEKLSKDLKSKLTEK